MDISYLLALQEFRDGAGAFLADFFLKMTFLAELNTLIIILAIIYWAVNKDFGTYLLMGWSGSRIVNGFLKITACVYRPWIRDTRIVPYGDSMTTATGYSFPSGHSTNGAALFGGVAVKKEVPKILRGLASGVLVMFLAAMLMKWIDANPGKDWMVLLIGVLISCFIRLFYVAFCFPCLMRGLDKLAEVKAEIKH
ncbi:MAG: hypothetical protein K6F54_12310 [Lachnospiraceae bacterium]|nr:hypothetical protein [Lachnospiraceae bacterium]